MRTLAIIGGKGGVGKSTLASNMLVAARLAGLDAVGLDLDHHQGSLFAWAVVRDGREPPALVVAGRMVSWRQAMPACALAIIDTPPGIDAAELHELALASDLVLVPALPEEGTFPFVGELAGALARVGAPIVFVLNRVVAGSPVLAEARAYLGALADVAPVQIPQRRDIQRALGRGAAVVESPAFAGCGPMRELWRFTSNRMGLV